MVNKAKAIINLVERNQKEKAREKLGRLCFKNDFFRPQKETTYF